MSWHPIIYTVTYDLTEKSYLSMSLRDMGHPHINGCECAS